MKEKRKPARKGSITENSGKNSGKSRGRPENLKSWKPGQSGNPGGRPKTAALSRASRELLAEPFPGDPQGRTFAQVIARTLGEKAVAGDIRAAQELADRAEGRPRQSVEIQNTTLRDAFERMSDDELEAYARDGKLPKWFPVEGGASDGPTKQ